jgi:hypothetical protein
MNAKFRQNLTRIDQGATRRSFASTATGSGAPQSWVGVDSTICVKRLEDLSSRAPDRFKRGEQSVLVARVQLYVVACCGGRVQSDAMRHDEGDGLSLRFAHLPRHGGAALSAMKQFVCDLVNQHREVDGRREIVSEQNPPAERRAVRRAELTIAIRDLDAATFRERAQASGKLAGVTSDFCERREWLAIRLADILSRDSATRSWQRRRGRRGRSLTWPEVEVPVATRRIAASV